MSRRVAVIDVGSNSIKALVAEPDGTPHGLVTVHDESLEVRISHGIGGQPPRLQPERIRAGVAAVHQLWTTCQAHGPLHAFRIVATSAVRSAANGGEFLDAVQAATGTTPVILTGAEEADGIANGVRTDPTIGRAMDTFTVFDLGGGSLELIRFERGSVVDRTSLPLGAVRLTEKFVSNPQIPVPKEQQFDLVSHVRASIRATGFNLARPLVGCSGGLAILRRLMEGNKPERLPDVAAAVPLAFVRQACAEIVSRSFAERITLSGVPADRADIFPAAMLTFQAILEMADAVELIHTLHNLRYGIAWQLAQD